MVSSIVTSFIMLPPARQVEAECPKQLLSIHHTYAVWSIDFSGPEKQIKSAPNAHINGSMSNGLNIIHQHTRPYFGPDQ